MKTEGRRFIWRTPVAASSNDCFVSQSRSASPVATYSVASSVACARSVPSLSRSGWTPGSKRLLGVNQLATLFIG
jgi:hypothetical protein